MRTPSKLLLAALAAALVLAAAIGTASANRLSVGTPEASARFRAVWTPLTFAEGGGGFAVRCNVTISGSFHSKTISKIRGALIGHVTSAALTRPCVGGQAWILNGIERLPNGSTTINTLPWHIIYDSFQGALPRITGVRVGLVGASFLIEIFGLTCLYRSTSASPAFGTVNLNTTTGVANSLEADPTTRIPINSGQNPLCPSTGIFSGTSSSLTNGEGTAITVRLI